MVEKTAETLQKNLSSNNSTIAGLERSIHKLEQYSRKECVEIAGTLRGIPYVILEDVVIKLLNKLP